MYDIILKSTGPRKLNVMKVICEVTELGLKEAKDIVESTPIVIGKTETMQDAEFVVAKLTKVGAVVEIR